MLNYIYIYIIKLIYMHWKKINAIDNLNFLFLFYIQYILRIHKNQKT